MIKLAEKYIRPGTLPFLFCPGCGNGTILGATIRAIDELGIMDRLALLGGIGCSGWIPTYINADVLHTLHGRAIAFATGVKLTDPERKVVVFTGDGDCIGIGGNHFIHAARRNIDMTVIMVNNQIYGMTGGQVAPTTPCGGRTQTSPAGNPERPFDVCRLAIASGATYVARWTSAHPRRLIQAIKEGIEHTGFSFIEVISQCPTQAGRYMYGTDSPGRLMSLIKGRTVTVAKAERMSEEDLKDKIVIGKLHHDDAEPEFTSKLYELMS